MSAQVIEHFYTCFQRKDYLGMNACYHPQIEFSDPVFVDLKGKQVFAMWHLLCERGTDLRLQFSDVQAQGDAGKAHWEAHYTFSGSGRQVHNIIDAVFTFKDGKIITHRDRFDFWWWSSMALGSTGRLLGWTPIIKGKVRDTAMKGLYKFIEKHPEYQS